MSADQRYRRFCERLFRQNEFAIKLGLQRMRAALNAEGSPDRAFVTILVAGTNGKGSVASFCHAGLLAAGARVGLFTSPHLVDVRERIRVDGKPIEKAPFLEIGDYCLRRWSDEQAPEQRLTYFELLTLVAALHFRQAKVDLAIFEVGLGGRLDATNALARSLCAITRTAVDHTEHLGTDLADIFGEKAAILRLDAPAVVCRPDGWTTERTRSALPPDATAAAWIEGEAFGRDRDRIWIHEAPSAQPRSPASSPASSPTSSPTSSPIYIDTDWIPLEGGHQRDNAACALALLERARQSQLAEIPRVEALPSVLSRARWPGRWMRVALGGVPLVVDGAHNPHAAATTAQLVGRHFPGGATVVLGVGKHKDLEGMVGALRSVAAQFVAVPLDNPRGRAPREIADVVRGQGIACEVAGSAAEGVAVAADRGRPIVALGSLYLVGEILRLAGYEAEQLAVIAAAEPKLQPE